MITETFGQRTVTISKGAADLLCLLSELQAVGLVENGWTVPDTDDPQPVVTPDGQRFVQKYRNKEIHSE